MKKFTISGLVAAQILLAAQPVLAADLGDDRGSSSQRHGAFAGARLRVPLGGTDREARASLAVAPLTQSRAADGRLVTRFGDGVELGFDGRETAGLSLGGTRLSDLGGRQGPNGRKLGISTWGWVGIGVGVAIVGTYAILVATYDPCCE